MEELMQQASLLSNFTADTNSNEERERKIFMQDLNKFMSETGKPLSKIPIMGYKELDLFQLYREVLAFGGFNEVVKNVGTWSKIWKRLANFDPSITDSSFRLKKNYERYLLEYEYKCKPEHRQHESEHKHKRHSKESPTSSPSFSRTLSSGNLQSSLSSSSNNNLNENNTNNTNNNTNNNETVSPSSPSSNNNNDDINNSNKKAKKYVKKNPLPSLETLCKIPRDIEGNVKLPLDFGDFVLESLGAVIPRSPFITEKYVFSVGYRITRMFNSMINPDITVKYTCSIIDGGDKPMFVIYAEDESKPLQGHSASAVWRNVFKKLSAHSDEAPTRKSINGTSRFGLTNPIITFLLKELVDKALNTNNFNTTNINTNYNTNSSPSNSPRSVSLRKRKSLTTTDSLSSEDENTISNNSSSSMDEETSMKFPRIETVMVSTHSCEEIVFHSRQELDDLETAVATLNALKFCTVY